MAPTMNITISVPEGTTNHNDPNILCLPAKWTDVLVFYVINYVAHAVTIRSLPGEKFWDILYIVALALIYPYSGLMRGLEAIVRAVTLRKPTDLDRAARAGALCVVIRTRDWNPVVGQDIENARIWNLEKLRKRADEVTNTDRLLDRRSEDIELNDNSSGSSVIELAEQSQSKAHWCVTLADELSSNVFTKERLVHGSLKLPLGYRLAILPSDAIVKPTLSAEKIKPELIISSSINYAKTTASITQVVFSSYTTYETRGDQLQRFGYAAFGLTVLPYLVMSIINLVANLTTPEYPALYMVRSPEMNEAEARGGFFEGVIGTVATEEHEWSIKTRFTKTENGYVLRPVKCPDSNQSNRCDEHGDDCPKAQTDFSQAISLASGRLQKREAHDFHEVLDVPSSEDQQSLLARYEYTADEMLPDNVKTSYKLDLAEYKGEQTGTTPPILLEVFASSKFQYHENHASDIMVMGLGFWLALIMSAIPFGVIGVLTHYNPGESALMQRVFTIGWLVIGMTYGLWAYMLSHFLHFDEKHLKIGWIWRFWNLLIFAAFAIGGFFVVGQQLTSFGKCQKIS